jgi:Fur family ferric uptake transcriptional regulator
MKHGNALQAVRARLGQRAYRMTAPRWAVIEEFAALGRYITAKELHERLRRRHARVGLATVYRTLETLESVGAAARAPQPHGETAYLFCPVKHHHHAVCTKCGKVADVSCGSLARLERALTAELRFKLVQHRFEFFGVCDRCS